MSEERSVRDRAEARRVLEERALEAGFDLVGVASAEPWREGGERLRQWQEAGMAADMGYMHRPVELLSDPKKLQKSARSVVSLGVSYYPGDHPENEGENQCGKGWTGTISARLWFIGNGRQRVVIGQISGVKNQQNAVHVAKALVVFVNKLTLGAPFHAISWIAGC